MHRPTASLSSSKGDSADFESEVPLNDRLKMFKSTTFDPQAYFIHHAGGMSEKEIRHLCLHLVALKKASAEEMRKSVYANYASFIRTSREISNLEGELVSLKNLLSSRANIIHGVAEGVRVESLNDGTDHSNSDALNFEDRELTKFDEWLIKYAENLDILLGERRVDEALAALDEGDKVADDAYNNGSSTPSALMSLRNSVMENRQKLADQLAESTCKPSTSGFELCASVRAMKRLGDGPRAHTLLLKSHEQKLNRNMQSLTTSGTPQAYTTSLSQLVFSMIAQAANDSLSIFNDEPAFASELVAWAVEQTEAFAGLIKKNVVSVPAASGCLRVVAECVNICLGHCLLLEDRGLALCPTLLKIFRPYLDEALRSTLKRIDLSTAALAASDDWSLTCPPVASRSWGAASGGTAPSQLKLSSSAHKFNSMVQELCEDIGSLDFPNLSEQALEGVLQSFNSYVTMMINAFPGSVETENLDTSGRRIVQPAETETQQVSLLANAVLLADELLPRATIKICPTARSDDQPQRGSDKQNRPPPEQRELKRRLQRVVDQLRDSFCRQHALELIFAEDGGVRLSADMYLSMDDGRDVSEWFPSPIYQELFIRLTRIASVLSDIFIGRERFATLLLNRLTETVILWFSEDPNFWEEIESGQRPLGPFGLQQFYLDMEFVILFTSQGRYLLRNLQSVMKNVISRAIEAVKANNIDPYSTLPEEDWFAEVAQTAIRMLMGYDDGAAGETMSPSARSVSSVHSHGSM
ncbi:exocyst complex component EXO84A-like [Andrographis paniculata]|uniref:exocyst complex component EXO84A-like n=1 Tax=Andrographis paniculata TaxID=175694 RepID=UPI0021E9596A|nr:exocyst complex component EXO84A-like [Andrographis paniculata]